MKIGTFSCWLFGHKFLAIDYTPRQYGNQWVSHKTIKPVDWCVRCGINQEIKTDE